MKNIIIPFCLILVALFIMPVSNGKTVQSHAVATFVVRWYDVGVYALEGRSGVLSVKRGWRGSNEINTVLYDPEKTTVEKMEELLKKSGTYIKTLQKSD